MPRHWLFGFESRHEPVLPRHRFVRRLVRNSLAALMLITVSLGGGMLGYHGLEGLHWIDAFVNASMILSGMGPVTPMETTAGKLFAGCYALYSGLLLIFITGIILTPVAHRVLHRFHVEGEHHRS